MLAGKAGKYGHCLGLWGAASGASRRGQLHLSRTVLPNLPPEVWIRLCHATHLSFICDSACGHYNLSRNLGHEYEQPDYKDPNVRALIIRIRFWSPLFIMRNPQSSIGNY